METCTYCDQLALYHVRGTETYLCRTHAQIEIVGPQEHQRQRPRVAIQIRPANENECAVVAEAARTAWNSFEIDCSDFEAHLERAPTLVAWHGDQAAGVICYQFEERTVHLAMLNVRPRWQGHGIGGRLIRTMLDAARAEGLTCAVVITTNDNLPALAFYQKLGFRISAVRPDRVTETHGPRKGFSGLPMRDEIELEMKL